MSPPGTAERASCGTPVPLVHTASEFNPEMPLKVVLWRIRTLRKLGERGPEGLSAETPP